MDLAVSLQEERGGGVMLPLLRDRLAGFILSGRWGVGRSGRVKAGYALAPAPRPRTSGRRKACPGRRAAAAGQ